MAAAQELKSPTHAYVSEKRKHDVSGEIQLKFFASASCTFCFAKGLKMMMSMQQRGRQGGGGGRSRGRSSRGGSNVNEELEELVVQEIEQFGLEVPQDEQALQSLVEGTRAYILAVLSDAVEFSRGISHINNTKLSLSVVTHGSCFRSNWPSRWARKRSMSTRSSRPRRW